MPDEYELRMRQPADLKLIAVGEGLVASRHGSFLAGDAGEIRWVLAEGGQASGPRLTGDTRQGSKKAITAVRQACVKVTSMLYDCKARAVALAGTQQSRS